jgi:hypothetical protein
MTIVIPNSFVSLLPSNGNIEIGNEIRELAKFCKQIELLSIKEGIISGLRTQLDKNNLEAELLPITDNDLCFLPSEDSKGRYLSGVVSKSLESARNFTSSGPECCCQKNSDPIPDTNKINNPRLYVHYRYMDLKIIPWIPCSYNCEHSIKIVNKIEKLMRSIDEQNTDALLTILSLPATWSLVNGQVEVITPKFKLYASSTYNEEPKRVEFK